MAKIEVQSAPADWCVLLDELLDTTAAEGVILKEGGKRYSMVKNRVDFVRRAFGSNVGIETHLLTNGFNDGDTVVVRAELTLYVDGARRVIGSGHASEVVGDSEINSTSAIENCETSAIGRALASTGLHGGEFASADEMSSALSRQSSPGKMQVSPLRSRRTDQSSDDSSIPVQPDLDGAEVEVLDIPEVGDEAGWDLVVEVFGGFISKYETMRDLMALWNDNAPLLDEMKTSYPDHYAEVRGVFKVQREQIEAAIRG